MKNKYLLSAILLIFGLTAVKAQVAEKTIEQEFAEINTAVEQAKDLEGQQYDDYIKLLNERRKILETRIEAANEDNVGNSSPETVGYCIPVQDCSDDDYIDDFTITPVGGTTFSNLNTACATNSYSDYTSMSISATAGDVMNFSVNHGVWNEGLAIFIDYNQNDILNDVGEMVWVSTSVGTSHTGSFAIPSTLPAGSYRLRLFCDYNDIPNDPCQNVSGVLGETEDYTLTITGSACATTASFTLYGLNKLWKNAGANDPNIFYHGITQTKRIRANTSGGVGPYTYVWFNSEGYTMKNQSGNQIQLFEPQSSCWVVCEITDIGAGCTFKNSVFIELSDEFYCGTPSNQWQLKMCDGGVSTCMPWNQAKAALKNNTATLGDCSRLPINIINPDFEIVYKTVTNILAPLIPNYAYISGNGPTNLVGPTVTFADNSTGNMFDIAGWSWTHPMGVTNVNSNFYTTRNMVAYTNGASFGGGTAEKTMSQTLSENVQQGYYYELTCDFGQRKDNGRPTVPPVLRLYAGNTLLTPIATEEPAIVQGEWVTWKRVYYVNNASITGALKVETGLGANNNGQQLSIDHVTLGKSTPLATVLKTEVKTTSQFMAYPNPTNGMTHVQFNLENSTQVQLEVVDVNGRVLISNTIQASENGNLVDVDLSAFANGLYFIRLMSDQGIATEKIQLMN